MRVGSLRGNHRLCNVSIVIEYKCLAVSCQVHVVNHLKLLYLVPLKRRHVETEPLQDFLLGHRELKGLRVTTIATWVMLLSCDGLLGTGEFLNTCCRCSRLADCLRRGGHIR